MDSLLKGTSLKSHSGADVSPSSLDKCELVGIYFSAHWCPPCRRFTPMLAKLYRALNKTSKRFEIIYASSDKDEAEYKEYWESMPWLSIPFKHSIAEALSVKYMIMGIPSLVLINPKTGETITTAGTTVINSDPEGTKFPWPEAVNAVAGGGSMNWIIFLVALYLLYKMFF